MVISGLQKTLKLAAPAGVGIEIWLAVGGWFHHGEALQGCEGLLRAGVDAGAEPGTAEAYRLFLVSTEVMYKIGAAIELQHLGYKFEKI